MLTTFITLLTLPSLISADITITRLHRVIDLDGNTPVVVTQKADIKRGSGSGDGVMTLIFAPVQHGGRVARFSCNVDGYKSTSARMDASEDAVKIAVPLPPPSSSSSQQAKVECVVTRVGPQARRPFPAKASQMQKHKFLFQGETTRVRTTYAMEGEETTVVELPSARIESWSNDLKPATSSGKTLTFGPYTKKTTSTEAAHAIRVHYEHDESYPVFTSAEREVEVSHWGAVSVEEFVDLRHDGAHLDGFFSRLDHTMRDTVSFQSLRAELPVGAFNIYYRDALGNVSTSSVTRKRDSTLLDLKFRFPLYGGWHVEWYHGYSVPLGSMVQTLTSAPSTYVLECDFGVPFLHVLVEDLTVKVILPPGATQIKVEAPAGVSYSMEQRSTWLDVPWAHRPLLVWHIKDYVSDVGSKSLRVSYVVPNERKFDKPAAVACAVMFVYMILFISGRLSGGSASSSSSVAAAGSKKKTKAL